ncbi:MAG: hypothetical protein ACKO0M_08355 [Cyanobium sp.]
MAEGQQQARAARLEVRHRLREPPEPLHLDALETATAHPEGQQQARPEEHPRIEPGWQEGEGCAGRHGRSLRRSGRILATSADPAQAPAGPSKTTRAYQLRESGITAAADAAGFRAVNRSLLQAPFYYSQLIAFERA